MSWVLALGFLGVVSLAHAQDLAAPKVALSLTVDQAQLVVQTLGAIGCQNVTQLMVCDKAAELLRSIQDQVKAQVK